MSKRFLVEVREVHVSTRVVEADDAEAAVKAVEGGEGDEVACEYSHTLDTDTWTVEEEEEGGNPVVPLAAPGDLLTALKLSVENAEE